MRTQFQSRTAAMAEYHTRRKTYDRVTSWQFTLRYHAKEPIKRLSAHITLVAFGVIALRVG